MATAPKEDYKTIAARVQQKVLDSIPPKWRLSKDDLANHTGNARAFITKCGVLTPRQLEITELTASETLRYVHNGRLKATEVTEAFCARAALAHQLVNCLTDFYPDEARAIAKAQDEEFDNTGKLVGPLHGMPMAVKVSQCRRASSRL